MHPEKTDVKKDCYMNAVEGRGLVRRCERGRGHFGFSLVEVALAMMVIAVGLMAIIALVP